MSKKKPRPKRAHERSAGSFILKLKNHPEGWLNVSAEKNEHLLMIRLVSFYAIITANRSWYFIFTTGNIGYVLSLSARNLKSSNWVGVGAFSCEAWHMFEKIKLYDRILSIILKSWKNLFRCVSFVRCLFAENWCGQSTFQIVSLD